jgi:uncharacterized protein YacL
MDIQNALLGIIAVQTTYLSVRSLTQTQFRSQRDKIVCDTSALIDGRIVTIARSGFLASELVIPKSVTRELQYMADKADHAKRERARYGLDVIQELQTIPNISVSIYDDGQLGQGGVDEQLLITAKKLGAKLCTTDYNLNKVARTEQITVVNVNELAHALRPMHLPGEYIQVQIVAPGQNKDQGVGYLDDGSMVVVDGGRAAMNSVVDVETIRVLQTEAGRMVFAKLRNSSPKLATKTQHTQKRRQPQKRSTSRKTNEDTLVELANQ